MLKLERKKQNVLIQMWNILKMCKLMMKKKQKTKKKKAEYFLDKMKKKSH